MQDGNKISETPENGKITLFENLLIEEIWFRIHF